ncbi:MAG: hypothetical protein PHP28_01610 [Actinomycetota bacterium]|nr:hypothetical protein [Actinomycetota bacterium]MDD5666716.1 hypothetical protein [Actinomycetota bacterium]
MDSGLTSSAVSELTDRPVDVKCYSGFKANERPLSFTFCEREFSVMDIEGSWFEQDAAGRERRVCFRVRADDGNLYLLSCGEGSDDWLLRRVWMLGNSS